MKKNLLALAVAAAVVAPGTAGAAKIYGDAVEIFGTLRLSADYVMDTGLEDDNLNIASNSTNVGFRGVVPIEGTDLKAFYHLEQQLDMDDGSGTWGGRDNYVGVATPAGKFSVGYISTPYKIMGIIFTNYVTTAADPFAILGAASSRGNIAGPGSRGVRLDLRSRNGVQWENNFGGVNVKLMYSAGMSASGEPDGQDDNDDQMWNGSAIWKGPAGLRLGAAFAKYDNWAGAGPEVEAYRLGAAWGSGPLSAEAIFEDMDSDAARATRRVYGANVGYNVTPRTNIGAQWMHADESDAGNDEADQVAVVLSHNLSKALQVHALYSTVLNDSNAQYAITDYGHDNVGSALGAEPQVFSLGMSFKF